MISNDILDEFLDRLKKEKIEYFLFMAKKPNKKQRESTPDLDLNIAHYQDMSLDRLLILLYCLQKYVATGEFDPNEPWDGMDDDSEEA